MKKGLIAVFCLIIIALLFQNCKKEATSPSWDVGILAPIIKTTLSIDNLVNDTLTQTGPDSLISIVYNSEMYTMALDSIIELPDTTIQYTINLENLDIGNYEIVYRTSLGDIANRDMEENGPGSDLYVTIMNAHNFGIPSTIDPIDQQVYENISMDAGEYFQTITIAEGFMDIEMDNQLPMDITNLIFELKNTDDGTIVFQDTFYVIPAFTTMTRTKSLAGLTIDGDLTGTVKLESPGTGGDVILDTAMALTSTITIRDLEILNATAVFPDEEMIDLNETINVDPGDQTFLNRVLVREGSINVTVFNTIEQPMHFNFTLYSATLEGEFLEIEGNVPAASGTTPGSLLINKNLAGYDVSFRGIGPFEMIWGDLNGNEIIDAITSNSLYYKLTGGIDSTGAMVTIDQNDSIYLYCHFSSIIPDYANGFLGNHTADETGVTDFEVVEELEDTYISLDDVRVTLEIASQIGVQAAIFIDELVSVNNRTGVQVSLSGPVLGEPFIISAPDDPYSTSIDVIPSISYININSSNSNIHELLENKPDQLSYSVRVETNYGILPEPGSSGTDFIYYGDALSASLNVEIPLSVIASGLILEDTTDLELNAGDVEDVLGGRLILIANNYFPFQAQVQMYLMDSLYNITDSLFTEPQLVQAGIINSETGKVHNPEKSKLYVDVSKERLNRILAAKKVRIISNFSTQPTDEHVKIFNWYTLELKIVADFNYRID